MKMDDGTQNGLLGPRFKPNLKTVDDVPGSYLFVHPTSEHSVHWPVVLPETEIVCLMLIH